MSGTEHKKEHDKNAEQHEHECSCCSCSANENIFCECEDDENEEKAVFAREIKLLSAAAIVFVMLLVTEEFYSGSVNGVLLGSAFICLIWLFFLGTPVWWALVLCPFYAAAVFRWV